MKLTVFNVSGTQLDMFMMLVHHKKRVLETTQSLDTLEVVGSFCRQCQ